MFSLIINHYAESSLDIAPAKFGNLALFVSGLAPEKKEHKNVKALNFSYEGRSRIILYSCRAINSG